MKRTKCRGSSKIAAGAPCSNEIRRLKTKLTKNGLSYHQIKRNERVAAYAVMSGDQVQSIEVFEIKIHPPTKYLSCFHEWFPSGEKFGVAHGKSFIMNGKEERAANYFNELSQLNDKTNLE